MKNYYKVAVILHLLFAFSQIGCAQTVSQKKSGHRAIAMSDRAHGATDRLANPELQPMAHGSVRDVRADHGFGNRVERDKAG